MLISSILFLRRKNSVKSTGDIKGFGTLRYEDQAKIKEKIGGGGVASTGKGDFSSFCLITCQSKLTCVIDSA